MCAARWARIAGGPAARVRLAAVAQDPGTDKGTDILSEEDAGDTCDEEVSGPEDVDPSRGSGAAGAMLDVRAFFRVFLATHRRRVYGSLRVFGQKVMYTVHGAGRLPGGSNQLVLEVLHLSLRARRLFPLAACCVPPSRVLLSDESVCCMAELVVTSEQQCQLADRAFCFICSNRAPYYTRARPFRTHSVLIWTHRPTDAMYGLPPAYFMGHASRIRPLLVVAPL